MLKEIVQEVDYDIYKHIFVKGCSEDPEASEATRKRLIAIVRDHL